VEFAPGLELNQGRWLLLGQVLGRAISGGLHQATQQVEELLAHLTALPRGGLGPSADLAQEMRQAADTLPGPLPGRADSAGRASRSSRRGEARASAGRPPAPFPFRAGPPHGAAYSGCAGRTRTRLPGTGAGSPRAAGPGHSDRPSAIQFRRCRRRRGQPARPRAVRHTRRTALANGRVGR